MRLNAAIRTSLKVSIWTSVTNYYIGVKGRFKTYISIYDGIFGLDDLNIILVSGPGIKPGISLLNWEGVLHLNYLILFLVFYLFSFQRSINQLNNIISYSRNNARENLKNSENFWKILPRRFGLLLTDWESAGLPLADGSNKSNIFSMRFELIIMEQFKVYHDTSQPPCLPVAPQKYITNRVPNIRKVPIFTPRKAFHPVY